MRDKSFESIFIISGKNPLKAKSGYASYSYSLAKILNSLGYQVKIFCVGEKNQVIKDKIGTVYVCSSFILKIPFLKNIEMAALPILSIRIASILSSHLTSGKVNILWGVGPWGMSAAILKILSGVKFYFVADYFTSIKHEFRGAISALNIADYGIWIKFKYLFAYITIIQFYSLLERFLLQFSDKIVVHYNSTKIILTTQFHIKHTRFVQLPYFVDFNEDYLDKTPISTSKPLIISVCRHDGRKGINYLLHSFKLLNNRKISYSAVIIGEGELRKKHIKLAQKLGLYNVSQPGSIEDIKSYFKKATLFVFPSLEEGSSSLSLLEAMKEGLPIVSTDVDGIPEDLVDGKNAILIPPKNSQALAEAMAKLLENPPLAKKLGKNARKHYYQIHNEDKVKKIIGNFLKGLSI